MRSKSFTLVELLVVIAIIAILAGLLLPAVMRALTESEIANMKLIINNIDLACGEYKNDWGVYPEEDSDSEPYTINLWGKLLTGGGVQEGLSYTGVRPGGGKGPYMELDDIYMITSMVDANVLYICDYWGTAIRYDDNTRGWDLTPNHNTGAFDLWSAGPDETWDTTDDVQNWEEN